MKIRAFILHMSISCDKIFLLLSKYLSLWPRPSMELAIIGGICVSQTHLVFYYVSLYQFFLVDFLLFSFCLQFFFINLLSKNQFSDIRKFQIYKIWIFDIKKIIFWKQKIHKIFLYKKWFFLSVSHSWYKK